MIIRTITREKKYPLEEFKEKLGLDSMDFDIKREVRANNTFFKIEESMENGDFLTMDVDSKHIAEKLGLKADESNIVDIYRDADVEKKMFTSEMKQFIVIVCKIGILSLGEDTNT